MPKRGGELPAWAVSIEAEIDDRMDWIYSHAADQVPSEVAFMEENWSHERVVRHYTMRVFRDNAHLDDGKKK